MIDVPRTLWRRFYDFRNRNWWQIDLVLIGVIIVLAIRPWH